MSRRADPSSKSQTRREEIVEVTLALLGQTPLSALTTRQIAAKMGLSQPALFRHFRSRDAILLAAIEQIRSEFAWRLEALLAAGGAPDARLGALGRALLAYARERPGLPALLFSEHAGEGPVPLALRHLIDAQRKLVAELFAQGQREGTFREDLEPRIASDLFVGLVQALVLRWRIEGREAPLVGAAEAALSVFFEGTLARSGGDGDAEPTVARTAEDGRAATARRAGILLFDVRPLLGGGEDPLERVLEELSKLAPGSVLSVLAPFEPRPLRALLRGRGHGVTSRPCGAGGWALDVVIGGSPPIEDLRDLPAPEPLERVLERVAALGAEETYLARLPRHPRLLLGRLEGRPIRLELGTQPDGITLLWARRRS